MESWLTALWYSEHTPPWWLRGLEALFATLATLRRRAYRNGWFASVRLPVPVIVIGNISVGGTGKTPLTVWLAGQLQMRGLQVGVVLRGYGARAHAPRLVDAGSDAGDVGDEALLIRQRAQCLVAVGADRVAAARLLLEQGADLVIADDGLQHLRLQRDVEIVVIDGTRGFGNGHLLPAGPLRERPGRLSSVTGIVINGGGARELAELPAGDGLPGAPTVTRMQLAGQWLQPLGGADAAVPLKEYAGQRVHAVAGIGNPRRFFAALRAAGLDVVEHPFGDHHVYRETDLMFGDALPVLMTEKDAVKCRRFAVTRCWYLPVEAMFDGNDGMQLLGRICLDAHLLDILACPLCRGPLQYERSQQLLICRADRLAFPIREGVPVMLEEEARTLAPDDPLLRR